ncbi:hypothetical protein KCP74_23900 [Salmonella enterica subsp. enterica]|nr:hypothetical protein KCP74_23900 [Salmonella enterica subsp. enterica]
MRFTRRVRQNLRGEQGGVSGTGTPIASVPTRNAARHLRWSEGYPARRLAQRFGRRHAGTGTSVLPQSFPARCAAPPAPRQ